MTGAQDLDLAALAAVVITIAVVGVVLLVAGLIAELGAWWEWRRQQTPPAPAVWPADRHPSPPFPYDLASWEDLGHQPGREVVR